VTHAEAIDEILRALRERGSGAYIGEPVSITEHMLQSAYAAEQDGASPTLVAAALLHDYGHLVHDLPEDAADHGVDTRHEEVAVAFLSEHFPPEVVEPIRMHVAAKRYLCAVDSSYRGQLSGPSLVSLKLQGGAMTEEEIDAFRRNPHHQEAVRLRRWDDAAKVPNLPTPSLAHYAVYLRQVAGSPNSR